MRGSNGSLRNGIVVGGNKRLQIGLKSLKWLKDTER